MAGVLHCSSDLDQIVDGHGEVAISGGPGDPTLGRLSFGGLVQLDQLDLRRPAHEPMHRPREDRRHRPIGDMIETEQVPVEAKRGLTVSDHDAKIDRVFRELYTHGRHPSVVAHARAKPNAPIRLAPQ